MRYNWNFKELEANKIILNDIYNQFDDEYTKYNIAESP